MTPDEELAVLRRLAELEGVSATPPKPITVGDVVSSKLPGFLGEAGKSIARGGANTLIGGLDALSAGELDPVTMQPIPNPYVKKAQSFVDETLGKGDNSYFSRGMEGIGSMLGPNQLGARIMTGLGGGFGGKAGGELAGKVDPQFAPAGEVIGSVLGGGIPARGLTGQRQPEAIVRGALEGTTPADWIRAGRNLEDFQQAGVQTGTLVDALNSRQALTALATELRNSPGGELFNQRVNNRGEDLTNLGNLFTFRTNLPDLGPIQPNNPLAVANQTSDAANAVLADARTARTRQYQADLAGEVVAPQDVINIYSNLMARASNPALTDAIRAAYREAALTLIKTDSSRTTPINSLMLPSVSIRNQTASTPITNLADLGSNIKALKANPPGENASTGAKIDASIYREALRDLERQLRAVSPAYARANNNYSATSRNVIAPLREGPIGRMRDVNPTAETPTPTSRLDALVGKDNSADAIARALAQLSGFGANPRAILQAVAQRKMDLGTTDPGATMRGIPGSPAEARLNTAIQAGGLDPAQVTQPLRAADNLQNFQNPPIVLQSNDNRALLGALLTPFRRGEFELTKAARMRNNQEISQLLSPMDQAGLDRLREIAMFNPELRRMLSAQLGFTSALSAEGE